MDIRAVANANGVIDTEAFPVHNQLSDEAALPSACRQGPVLPGEVDFNVWQHFDPPNPEHFARTLPEPAIKVSTATGYLISDPGDGPARAIADMHHAVLDMGRESGWPDDCVSAVQLKARAVQYQFTDP